MVFKILNPISLKLCEDPVYVVRKKAAKKFAKMFLLFTNPEDELMLISMKESIINFSLSPHYNMRQT